MGRHHAERLRLPAVGSGTRLARSFIFIQGISLRLSIRGSFNRFLKEGHSPLRSTFKCLRKCLKRAVILYLLTWLINQSTSFKTIRFLGGPPPSFPSPVVLAYFAAAGLVNSLVLLFAPVYHTKLGVLSRWNARAHYADDPHVHEW